jgi:adenosylcobinamide kinase/adenosylcobinamide-phosphate guanylyltransferase
MGKRLTLVLGGARSGKSAYAQRLAAERGHPVLFVATAEPLDKEMAARIARHRAQRPSPWRTLEVPRRVGAAIDAQAGAAGIVLLDCLSMLAANVLASFGDAPDLTGGEEALTEELDLLLSAYERSPAEWILVSNEVGMGIVPSHPLGRAFRDLLGRAHQRFAARADSVYLLVAGLPLRLK